MTAGACTPGSRAKTVLEMPRNGFTTRYAAALLETLGVRLPTGGPGPDRRGVDPATAWARSGAMHLTGLPGGPPLEAPGPAAACMEGAAYALALLSCRAAGVSGRGLAGLDAPALLGERAALAEPPLARRGGTSAGGSCHLLRCVDEFIALNLARPSDVELLPAWLEVPRAALPFAEPEPRRVTALARVLRDREAATLIERGRLLGLPATRLGETVGAPPPWCRVDARGPARAPRARPLVVDLSSLWAGPLAASLLGACGADVVKVESLERPDGARRGSSAFFDLLNGEKRSVAISLATDGGVARLRALLDRADVVVESSRPRALAQLGIDAAACVAARPGQTWVSITGYGRGEPEANHVAFGDDAAVSAGLVATAGDGAPVFCGDAIADPLTGLHAAVAALASFAAGGGVLLDVPLTGVAAHVMRSRVESGVRSGRRSVERPPERGDVLLPRARLAVRPAPPLGRDTAQVFTEQGIDC